MVVSFIDPKNKENFGKKFLQRLNQQIRTGERNSTGTFRTWNGRMDVSTLIISITHEVDSLKF